MDERVQIISRLYENGREDTRLTRSRRGQLEFLTTMDYIHRLCPQPAKVLEIGAGTGAYSVALAREGYGVTAVELVDGNLRILRERGQGLSNLVSVQGDALDLGRWADSAFDLVLCLGPMYHLFDRKDMEQALDEAIRVTRPGGVLMAAFLSVHAILFDNYLQAEPNSFRAGLAENFTPAYETRHFAAQGFTGFQVKEFEALLEDRPVEHLATVATDGILELAKGRSDFVLSDEDFAAYAAYHLRFCEERELLGSSSHLLYVGRKRV